MSDSPISDYRSNEGSTKSSRKMKPSKNCNISVSEANTNRNAVLPNYSHVFYSRSYKGGYMVYGNMTQIYILKYIFSHFFLFFKFCLYYFQIMKHILRSTMFQIKPTECKMLSSKITTSYFNMKWDPFLIIVLLNYLENRRYV